MSAIPPPAHAAIDAPSAWVVRHAARIPAGEVLDLACGSGRHARWLAARGWPVLAVDRDAHALQRAAGAGIVTHAADLESGAAWPFAAARFAGIVVTNYLHRPLFAAMLESLAPGGVIIYETFARGNEQFGKPSNPAFLLAPGELLALIASSAVQRVVLAEARPDAAPDVPLLHVLAYEDGYVDLPKPAVVQRICVRKAGPAGVPAAWARDFALHQS